MPKGDRLQIESWRQFTPETWETGLKAVEDAASLGFVLGVGDELLLFELIELLQAVGDGERRWGLQGSGRFTPAEKRDEGIDADQGDREEEEDCDNDDKVGSGQLEEARDGEWKWGGVHGSAGLSAFGRFGDDRRIAELGIEGDGFFDEAAHGGGGDGIALM